MAADADADTKRRSDDVRAALARLRRLREQMIRSGAGVVHHLRRAAEIRRRSGRADR